MKQASLHALALITLVALPAGLAAQRDSIRSRVLSDDSKTLAYTATQTEAAQDPAAAFAQYLFPPELVMRHQSRLKLTEGQRSVIVQEINRLQATAVQVQWRVADESEKLTGLLERDSVSEAEVLAQAERMMGFEVAVKRAQLSMLIRIRNVLSAEQRAMLRDLQKRD